MGMTMGAKSPGPVSPSSLMLSPGINGIQIVRPDEHTGGLVLNESNALNGVVVGDNRLQTHRLLESRLVEKFPNGIAEVKTCPDAAPSFVPRTSASSSTATEFSRFKKPTTSTSASEYPEPSTTRKGIDPVESDNSRPWRSAVSRNAPRK